MPALCAFRPRCRHREQCPVELGDPALKLVSNQHHVRCHLNIKMSKDRKSEFHTR
jgi:hypothetical protein